MNYGSRENGPPSGMASGSRAGGRGTARQGSVKAARERLEVAQNTSIQEFLSAGQPRAGSNLVSQFKARPRENQTPPSSRGNASVQRDTQWPLMEDTSNAPPGRGPPQRPPRPSFVPSLTEPTNISQRAQDSYQPQQSYHASNRWHEEDYLSANYNSNRSSDRPITLSSQSEASSLGDIPDFPVAPPSQTPGARRVPSYGPPPTQRRGPSSYYSQMSFVSPIREESEGSKSHNSYASSNVIPANHGHYYSDNGRPSSEFVQGDSRSPSNLDRADGSLVRQASLGKKTKPSLTTIKSGDALRSEAARQDKMRKGGVVGQAAVAAGAAGGAFAAGLGSKGGSKTGSKNTSRVNSPGGSELSSGTGLLDDSSSDSESLISPIQGATAGQPKGKRSRSPIAVSALESGPSTGNFSEPSTSFNATQQSTMADRRRPPRLNMDVVRDAEARGSMTSLPDLIRRATRLAANLDRGKTASRLGMDFWPDGAHGNGNLQRERGSGSLSDMLASFPPPALGTPNESTFQRGNKWPPRGMDELSAPQDEKFPPGKKGRRCCGMPLWVFIVVMIILFLLIAAAVVVPVVLIVLPKQNNNSPPQSTLAPGQCTIDPSFSCQNGGVAFVTPEDTCSCLCNNNFTGERCTTSGDASCTTTDLSGTGSVTLGSAIPRLLEGANSNFSIPLDSSQILSQFNANGLSCRSENALVNLNGNGNGNSVVRRLSRLASINRYLFDGRGRNLKVHMAREDTPEPSRTLTVVATTPTSTSSSASTATADATSDDDETLDFARISVLFILQESRNFKTATDAQGTIRSVIGGTDTRTDRSNITTSNFEINLDDFQITVPNGTVVGRK